MTSCFLWYHKWTKWGDLVKEKWNKFSGGSMIKGYTYIRNYQERTCDRCNLKEQRYID